MHFMMFSYRFPNRMVLNDRQNTMTTELLGRNPVFLLCFECPKRLTLGPTMGGDYDH
jgi:hypothetical protein